MSSTRTRHSRLDHRYTVIQYVLGSGGILLPIANTFFPIRIFDGSLLMPTLASKILFACAGLLLCSSAYARSKEHPVSSRLTIWSTIVGAAVLYPLGTLAFIYWLVLVRRRERAGVSTIDRSQGENGRVQTT